jgi:hypothetical protein
MKSELNIYPVARREQRVSYGKIAGLPSGKPAFSTGIHRLFQSTSAVIGWRCITYASSLRTTVFPWNSLDCRHPSIYRDAQYVQYIIQSMDAGNA